MQFVSRTHFASPRIRSHWAYDGNGFLDAFGQSHREFLADIDPKLEPNLVQTLMMINSPYVDGKVLDAKAVAILAALPSKTQLQAQLLGMFAGPMRGFVGVLAANPGGFVRVLSAREKQLAESAS